MSQADKHETPGYMQHHLESIPVPPITTTENDAAIEQDKMEQQSFPRVAFFEAMRKLMQPPFTPWWTRVWIIQEASVARDIRIVHGTISAPWEMFATAATHLLRREFYFPRHQMKVIADFRNKILDVEDLRRTQRLGIAQTTLLDLLRKFRDKRATDVWDKVYALMSLVQDTRSRQRLRPNYKFSVVEVFRRATIECINSSGSLSVFSTDLTRKFRDDLPSWVPDWSAPSSVTYATRAATVELYDTGHGKGNDTDEVVKLCADDSLEVQGSPFDVIKSVGTVMWDWHSSKVCCEILQGWRRNIGSDKLLSGEIWRLLCADVLCWTTPGPLIRRTVPDDELTFIMWTILSPRSPFHFREFFEPHRGNLSYLYNSTGQVSFLSGRLWLVTMLMWPQDSVLNPRHDFSNSELYKKLDHYNARKIFFIQLFRDLRWQRYSESVFVERRDNNIVRLRKDAPWRELVDEIRKCMIETYGENVDLDLETRSTLSRIFDQSVMAATLNRRLIIGEKYIGLGPATVDVGDRLFFLHGGKTPFILRPCSSTGDGDEKISSEQMPTVKSSQKHEILGDCYVQDFSRLDARPESSQEKLNYGPVFLV